MLPRILSVSGIGNSFNKTGSILSVYLIYILMLLGSFSSPAPAQQNPAIDSIYTARLDSLLSLLESEKPLMEPAPFEEMIKTCLGRDDMADSLRVGLYILLRDYYCECGRCKESLDLLAAALNDESVRSNACLTGRVCCALADIYLYLNEYNRAESMLIEALSFFSECPISDQGQTLQNLAQTYLSLGRYKESDSLYRQAIRIFRESGDVAIPDIINCLTGLAHVNKMQARFHESESAYLEAISLAEEYYGPYNTSSIPPLLSLGGLYLLFGQFHQSESVLQQARNICDSAVASDHPYRAGVYASLGVQYLYLGKYYEARKSLQAALDIQESLPVPDMPNAATTMIWLANAESELGNYDEAIKLFNRGNEIYKTILSDHHPHQSSALTHLANTYLRMENYELATQFIDSALIIYVQTLGEDHPYYGIGLMRKGEILSASRRYEEAKECFLKAIAILKRHYDPYHQRLVLALQYLARACCSSGEVEEGHQYYREFLSRRLKFIEYAFSFSSDEQKLRWVKNNPVIDNSLISWTITTDDRSSVRDACEMVLRGKGIVIDALATQRETAYCSYDSTIMALVSRHRETSETIAALASVGKFHESDIYRKDTIEALYQVKDSLENELSRRCSKFSDLLASLRFNLKDVTGALAPEEILLEYIRYSPYDFDGTGNDAMRTGPGRYAVFIVPARGDIKVLDLGSADEIDSLVHASLAMIHATGVEVYTPAGALLEQQLRRITGRLHEIILAPINEFLGGRDKIFVSPDGALNLLPFEILPDYDSTYVIERLLVRYLTSGRDLIRNSSRAGPPHPYALIIADPEFDTPVSSSGQLPSDSKRQSAGNSDNCLMGKFNPLPYTRFEATEISGYFQASHKLETAELYGPEASEQALKELAAPPRVLHLATHGVFCGGSETEDPGHSSNPMLRAGFALAGANSHHTASTYDQGFDDGILYALEIATLNLQNTELAVLSACETGYGDILDGEGVIGLRRAFQQAGVQAIVMSLWTVPDQETSRLMSGFYKRWLEGTSKSEALRQSSLEVLREQRLRRGNGHPYYWGGFILSGNSQ